MVDYSAFNVDPLRYQQAGMMNALNTAQLINTQRQQERQNALYQKQQQMAEENMRHDNALNQSRFALEQKKYDTLEQLKRQNIISDGVNFGLKTGDPRKAPTAYRSYLTANGITDIPEIDFSMLKSDGSGTYIADMGMGHKVKISGSGSALVKFNEMVGRSINDRDSFMRAVEETGVKFEPYIEGQDRDGLTGAEVDLAKLAWEQKKYWMEQQRKFAEIEKDKLFEANNIHGNPKEGFYIISGEKDEATGDFVKMPAGEIVDNINKITRNRAAKISRIAEESFDGDYDAAAIYYDQMVEQQIQKAMEEEEKKAKQREAQDRKNRAQRSAINEVNRPIEGKIQPPARVPMSLEEEEALRREETRRIIEERQRLNQNGMVPGPRRY